MSAALIRSFLHAAKLHSRFEPSTCALPGAVGIVSVISPNGTIVRDIVVPGPSVEGVALSDDETCLYVSEASTKCVYKVAL